MSFRMDSSLDPSNRKTQYTIVTKNVSYGVSLTNWSFHLDKRILRNVNCEVKPGESTALAGPSGAGKTTLLGILAGFIPLCRVSGQVVVNDRPMNTASFRRVSGYVTQEDILFPLLTVEETLIYTLRLRKHSSYNSAKARVRKLLVELGLSHVSGARVGGGSHRGISGGERRRVSIGVELVHDPAVLLMDEPTSGLDSAASLQVMSMLKSMAKDHGKTIVLTIHQPGIRILELIDQVLLLANGTVVHQGSLDLLEQRIQLVGHRIPHHVNVLEFSIEVIKTLYTDENVNFDIDLISTQESNDVNEDIRLTYANSPLKEVMILSQRFCHNNFRTKTLLMSKLVLSLISAILLGITFKNIKELHMQTQIGFFFSILSYVIYSSSEALPVFLEERRILMKEISVGAYRVSSYTFANTLMFIPFLLIAALLYAVPIYWLVGLRADIDGFLYFVLVIWLVLLMSNSFVACCSTLVPNFMMGISMVGGLMGTFFLFSGYFISINDIPKYCKFMYHLSFVRYAFESLLLNEYGGAKGKGRCLERFEGGCSVYGEEFLKMKNLKEMEKWHNLGIMLGFIFGYRFLSLLVLCYKSYKRRN